MGDGYGYRVGYSDGDGFDMAWTRRLLECQSSVFSAQRFCISAFHYGPPHAMPWQIIGSECGPKRLPGTQLLTKDPGPAKYRMEMQHFCRYQSCRSDLQKPRRTHPCRTKEAVCIRLPVEKEPQPGFGPCGKCQSQCGELWAYGGEHLLLRGHLICKHKFQSFCKWNVLAQTNKTTKHNTADGREAGAAGLPSNCMRFLE